MTFSPSTWKARRVVRGRAMALWLIAAVAVGIGARLFIQERAPLFVSDTFQNLLLARSLANGTGFHSGGSEHPDASRLVLFPAVVAIAVPIAGDVEDAARWVVVLAGALGVIPLFALARSMFGPRAAWAALPLGAASCLVGASDRMLATSLYVLLALGTAALTWRARSGTSRRRWLAAGACGALAALTRPEGLMFPFAAAAWALIDPGRRRAVPRRLADGGMVLIAAVAVYGPYVVWASSTLGRFVPAPGVAYVQMERIVSDHLGLREQPSPVAWTDRARFMLTADHRSLFLETAFLTGRFPDPDPEVPSSGERPAPGASPVVVVPSGQWRSLFVRRWYIVRSNLLRLPWKAAWDHFLPPMVVALALIGTVGALRSRRGRTAAAFLALMLVASSAPVASHLESRFFLMPFAIATIMAAHGWGTLARALSRRTASPFETALVFVAHGVVLAGLVISGLRHEAPQSEALARTTTLRSQGAAASAILPRGPVLAIQPHFPYWSDRPYRPIPFASPSAILDYARSQGARGLVLEGARDLDQRPDLTWLTGGDLPTAFRIVLRAPHPNGGELLVFEIAPSRTS